MGKKKEKIVEVDMYHKYADIDEMYASKNRKIQLLVPSNLRMLCAILDVKVEKLLSDFMWMLSYSHHSSASDKQREIGMNFILTSKYGQPLYSKKQIKQMFLELKAERKIHDTIDGMDYQDMNLFSKNCNMYKRHWFKKWFEKNRHKADITALNDY